MELGLILAISGAHWRNPGRHRLGPGVLWQDKLQREL